MGANQEMQSLIADMQHHDVVTGTSSQEVVHDYIKKIQDGLEKS
jgi:hypothetical protein